MTMYCVVYSSNANGNDEPEVQSVHGIFAFLKNAIEYANKQTSERIREFKGDWDTVTATEETLESNMFASDREYHNWKIFAVKGE